MKTLVSPPEQPPRQPTLGVSTTTVNATQAIFWWDGDGQIVDVTRHLAPPPDPEREPYRTTAYVERPREIGS